MQRAQTQIRILIIDDDEDDFLITSEYIRQIPGADFVIDWCYRYEDGLERLREGQYDLYFTDYRLGARTGIDLLKDAQERNYEVPIILLTGKGNREIDMEAMQLGAVDYLVKPELNPEKIERSIRYALERVEAMRAIKSNERKYRGIFENTKDLVFLTDEMLDFKDVNQAALNLLGYEKAEMLQLNLCDLVEQAQHKKYLQHTIASKKEINDWEVVLSGKDGEKRICILTATLEDGLNDFGYVQGIIHDITLLRREEKATLQTEKLAATARLVRTLAHEVRNPLNNITLSAEQLQQEALNESAVLYLNIIERNSRRISDLISELLNSSKPGESTLIPEYLQVVMDDVIAAAMDRLTLKRIQLQLTYPDDESVLILADREKLKLALLNIVINAIEAMQEGAGKLVITLEPVNDYAVLSISDNGCGISEENITRLFEPYFTQKRNGMGLGLAFTMNILQAHKALIDVQSSLGVGTVFTVSLPLLDKNKIEAPADELTAPVTE